MWTCCHMTARTGATRRSGRVMLGEGNDAKSHRVHGHDCCQARTAPVLHHDDPRIRRTRNNASALHWTNTRAQIGRVGRADTMGLAISLVAEVPEKVWFCTVKGMKPWLAPDSSNTRTTDKGGHTIW